MPDTLTPAQRRKCMAAIRGKDTRPELTVRSIAHRLGFRFRLHVASLPGKPDLVFPGRRKIVLVNGCFFHRHTCARGRSTPRSNAAFWRRKRDGNKERDRRIRRALRRLGWKVLTIWECHTRDARRIEDALTGFLSAGG
jgi:DNA mismatch endonuclease (patch repair protein)